MAGGSSSKRKLSKKKSLKTTSQKKKSKRKEFKKRSRDYDSVSSYSDDESLNSGHASPDHKRRKNKHKKIRRDLSGSSHSDDKPVNSDSDSLSTYDDSNKKQKKKARRSRIKSSKKRTKKRHDSTDDDDEKVHSVRKRKERVVKPRKKSSKKKSKKYLSSSSSSDSESYQSDGSSSSPDRKRKRSSKVILDREIEKPRGRESYKTSKKRKTRSPSCSSRGTDGDRSVSVDHSDGTLAPVNNSRRLKSVITFVDRSYDEEENKEEMVYDYDDYPSPKSIDSNEGGIDKRELDGHFAGVENVVGEEITEVGKFDIDEGDRNNVDTNKLEKEKEGLGAADLELILRQKALENLRKFRGGMQTGSRTSTDSSKMNNESDVKGQSPGKVAITQNKLVNRSSSSAREMNLSSGLTLETDSSRVVDNKIQSNSEHIEQEPGVAKEASDDAPDDVALLGLSEEDKGKAEHITGSDASSGLGTINACSYTTKPTSSVEPISEEQSLEEQQNEAKDGEFKQKTMSVMRGGEMVQVSYKVYIPKKAPALARRQLRR